MTAINMNQINLNIHRGMLFPSLSIARILNGKNLNKEWKKSQLKGKIYVFMQGREKTTVSDICDNFNLDPESVIKILNEMESDGKIRQV